ncbi:MAG: ATP synthase F1 subunit gamma [Spirochaetes bacterium]|nr:ATP synthase F1 subunit gamma [Spirochaetota bacterium]MBU1078956.1 ATP synthase F1 subunit gamma [Spirochaetota bacterium]
MESMRDVRSRIKSVSQTLTVTSAMKLISTAKLRKARRRLDETVPYFEAVRAAMADIVDHSEHAARTWFDKRARKPSRRIATLVITSDRGLAGAYNAAIIRFVEDSCPSGSILIPVGAIGKRHFMKRDYVLMEDFSVSRKEPTVYEAKDIAAFAVDLFLSGRVDEFRVAYTNMISTVKQVPELIGVLPLEREALAAARPISRRARAAKEASGSYSYEPDEESVFARLVPFFVKGVVYGALVEAFASEQSARMSAMDSASRNAGEMIARLTGSYNRARQAAITAEVSEIVAGAAAQRP